MRDYSPGGSNNSDALMFGDGQRFEMAQSGVNEVRRKIKNTTEKRSFSPHPREKALQISRLAAPGLVLAAGLLLFSISMLSMLQLSLFYDPEMHTSMMINQIMIESFICFILGIVILFVFYKYWIAPDIGLRYRSWKKRRV